jgi:hypothetical protein
MNQLIKHQNLKEKKMSMPFYFLLCSLDGQAQQLANETKS